MQWNPKQYLKFEEERNRPVRDLLAMVPLTDPQHIVDLGCGPGNSTELLAKQFPSASILGLDSSAEMLKTARERLPNVQFIQANIAEWDPPKSTNLIFANAVFQWIPNHLGVLKRLLSELEPASVLAMQVPDNLTEPSHALMRTVAGREQWKKYFSQHDKREEIPSPAEYYTLLRPLCQRLDIWHTYYQHPLKGPEAIVEMVKSTGLSPYLQQLPAEAQQSFLDEYEAEIAKSYPCLVEGMVLFRFPRLFLVACI
jgi:trans-aconitate 2-methyltransferase